MNVKTSSETIEQRLKIIRDESLGNYAWNSSNQNDWTRATLMKMLNVIYYESGSGECWTGTDGVSSQSTCTFDGSDSGVKGLNEISQNMIDENIIWNIGGSDHVATPKMYEYERGITVYTDDSTSRLTEWKKDQTNTDTFHSIGLAYPSDYGYATNGGTLGRKACFAYPSRNWNTENYQTQCAQTDWLKPASGYMWLLTPSSGNAGSAYFAHTDGYTNSHGAHFLSGVWPTLYLKNEVKITGGTGEYNNPYILTLE